MTVFSYHREITVQDPLEYVAQILVHRKWVQLGRPKATQSLAQALIVRHFRKSKVSVEGRIVALGVVSTQNFWTTK